MKSNLISAIAGWKSAALLALVAMVAAVAFSGILTSTNSADAAGPGDRTTVTSQTLTPFQADGSAVANSGVATFTIIGGTASGSFTANGGQSLVCADETACDQAKLTNDPPAAANTVTVSLTIDEDSPNGFILVSVNDANAATGGTINRRIDVSTADRVVSLTASGPVPGVQSAVAADGTDTVTITATLRNSAEGGVAGKKVLVYTTLGLLDSCGDATDGTENNVQACTETSAEDNTGTADVNEAGQVVVTLKPTDREGVATVNFTLGDLTASVDAIFFGDAATISAEADQSSIAIGGSTYIVVTVLDAGGNAVAGHPVDFRAGTAASGDADGDGVAGPGPKAVEVNAIRNRDKDAGPPAGTLRVVDTKLGDLPACGNHTTNDHQDDQNNPTNLEAPAGTDVGEGTNAAGKCVIHVDAPKTDSPATTASRGTNVITLAGPAADRSADVTVEIAVGGAPATITTDAPERVDPISSTKVTVTVVDDEGVLVGAVDASVNQVEGEGKVIAGEGDSMTSDGVVSFTYLAPSTPGTAGFRITAGTGAGQISHNVIIAIGPEPVVEEEPEGPPPTWSEPLASGTHNLVWNGEDGADPSAGAEGVAAIWRWTGDGWQGYFPDAAEVPGGNNLESLTNGAAYWVIVE